MATMESACAAAPAGGISVMWKTVSEDCNLACDYCYYSTCGGKPGPQISTIALTTMEKFMREYMALTRGVASFAWQGGEPLLAGLDFFKSVVALQAKYAPAHTVIANALQTNGTLIHERWAAFFRQYRFLLGVSIDGPRHIHDLRRVDAQGQGSFERVMRGIDHLRKQRVDFNVLTVIHRGNVGSAKELFVFYRREGFQYVQFIPCMQFHSQQVQQPGVYEITPEEYGEFLCEAFDCWYNDGSPVISERFFDNMLSVYAGRDAELCTRRQSCARTLVLEQNGDAFPCDFYMHPEWKIGNVGTDALTNILNHPLYEHFLKMKPRLPEACRSCEWLDLCYGGCPRNRRWNEDFSVSQPDYFCHSYRRVYAYAHERMMELADRIRRNLFAEGVRISYGGRMPGRNDPCACGSGKKFKVCCQRYRS